MDLPVLKGVEQVSDGWLKKYVLTYDLPDGRGLNYEVVSRKGSSSTERRFATKLRRGPQRMPCVS